MIKEERDGKRACVREEFAIANYSFSHLHVGSTLLLSVSLYYYPLLLSRIVSPCKLEALIILGTPKIRGQGDTENCFGNWVSPLW